MMRTTAGWLTQTAVLLLLLGVVTAAVRFAESKLAFFPLQGETRTPDAFGIAFTATTLETADGERIRVWQLPRADARARIVYFHGNGGNLSLWSDVLAGLWQHGLEVVAVDYRGYGVSTGQPSESGLYRDVDATLAFVHEQLPRSDAPLIYWGRSLGTPMAAYAASRKAPDGVILESGFPTMRSVLETNPIMWVMSWLSNYSFPTAQWMAAVASPVLVLHGDSDSVIRYRLGQRLFERLPGPKRFVTLPGVDHNDLPPADWPLYWDAVLGFVGGLPSRRAMDR
jgi:fermentation-respiration switch protein FrsA (DUF1100 family)